MLGKKGVVFAGESTAADNAEAKAEYDGALELRVLVAVVGSLLD